MKKSVGLEERNKEEYENYSMEDDNDNCDNYIPQGDSTSILLISPNLALGILPSLLLKRRYKIESVNVWINSVKIKTLVMLEILHVFSQDWDIPLKRISF